METRKAKMIVNKGGNGGSTFRATIPTNWIRIMGLDEEKRNLKLEFDGSTITITNNEEEIKMLNNLLEIAKIEIEEEIEEMGFIDDSDNCDRFLDSLAKDLVEGETDENQEDFDTEELTSEVLEMLDDYMKKTYKREGKCNDRGDYTGCYYKDKEGLKSWCEFGE